MLYKATPLFFSSTWNLFRAFLIEKKERKEESALKWGAYSDSFTKFIKRLRVSAMKQLFSVHSLKSEFCWRNIKVWIFKWELASMIEGSTYYSDLPTRFKLLSLWATESPEILIKYAHWKLFILSNTFHWYCLLLNFYLSG